MAAIPHPEIDRIIQLALEEDLGEAGDITSQALIPDDVSGVSELWAKEPMVLSGLSIFKRAFEKIDKHVTVLFEKSDGEAIRGANARVAQLAGPLRSLLIGERTALNLLQCLSGIATLTAQAIAVVEQIPGSKLKVLDTRKTLPGLRILSKQAVRHGGAYNHRLGLFDGILIKNNHIAAVGGSVREALRRAKAHCPKEMPLEIEVTSLEQLKEAIDEGAQRVMLDNMNDESIAHAITITQGRVELEISGGVTLERLPALAKLGVDYVSMGMLTHSAPAVDLSMTTTPAAI